MKLTQELMKTLFDYNKETGHLIWKSRNMPRWDAKWVGKPVGSSKQARAGRPSQTRIDGTLYFVHKLVWLYYHGYWANCIDHKNGDNHDNRIENLREALHPQNMANRNRAKRGIYKTKYGYRARIGFLYDRIHLGYFNTKEEALAAYRKASVELHGEFSSYSRS